MKKLSLALVGASGAVGRSFLRVLEERGFLDKFNVENFYLFASHRSAGTKIACGGKEYVIEELREDSFDRGVDVVLSSAGGAVSERFMPIAAAKGAVVIDNTSFFRMKPDVPLVVPEVNPEDIFKHKGIIANPNCSTIQVMVALKPLMDAYGLKRVVYSTYQAVSGAGQGGVDDLINTAKGLPPAKFAHPIAGNCLPHIDSFMDDGYTKEEIKMIEETRKILHLPDLSVTSTNVRVPVMDGHSVSVNVELTKPYQLVELIELMKNSPGIVIQNDGPNGVYPMPITAAGRDEVFVGRIRRDFSVENGLNMWVVADNTRKGAATNTIQIAEIVIEENMR
jgi:aspartate-semialdehyde dehydrogenase